MSQSLYELKILFFFAFPLLCAGRALERINFLIVAPSVYQQEIFGRIVAYPWQYRQVVWWFDKDTMSTTWTYRLPSFPTPLGRCTSDHLPPPRDASADYRACSILSKDSYLSAGWNHGEMRIQSVIGGVDANAEEPL